MTMKKLLSSIFVIIGLLSISGCSTGPGEPQINKLQSNNKTAKINLNFPSKDPVTEKPFKLNTFELTTLKLQLANKLVSYSNYPAFYTDYYTKRHHRRLIPPAKGIKIKTTQSSYKIIYANGEYNNQYYLAKTIFPVPYKIEQRLITLHYPNEFIFIPCNDAIGGEIKPLDNVENLKQDVERILSKAPNTKLKINRSYTFKGEVNTPYPSESVYANFKRLVGQYQGRFYDKTVNEIEKKNYFNLKIKDHIYPLKITVYPYRNGSKVVFEANINYTLYSDGSSSISKQDIEKAKEDIEKIINN